MRVDVLIPTYNRAELLGLALNSLLRAPVPSTLSVTITVIDNNSSDSTRQVVESRMAHAGQRLRYERECAQGRSHALNRGIVTTDGDLVAMLDDDEEIDPTWFSTIEQAFTDPEVDFIGGPYVPRWATKQPAWLPHEYGAVVGWVDGGDSVLSYDDSYPGILMGGNAVVRRTAMNRVGLYATWLGHTGERLLSGEDRDFYFRLRATGAKGLYLPHLVIYHHIPAERCTKRYFRLWMFWHGVSLGLLERRASSPVARFLGVPRWRFREAAAGALSAMSGLVVTPREPARAFARQLTLFELSGMLYGRHLYKRSGLRHWISDRNVRIESAGN
jgi:glucosyl-dolichyl phosphate glucuronosyltransferase